MTRRILVTGGGSGIGQATCASATRRGWAAVALDRDADGLAETQRRSGAGVVVCDVTDESAVEDSVGRAVELLGGAPDGLVAAAGVYDIRAARDTTSADLLRVLTVNTVGAFLAAQAFLAARNSDHSAASVVFLASLAADCGDASEPGVAYAASKWAIVAMTRQLAVEWATRGVRVNAVSPGVIDTPMLRLMDDPKRGEVYLSRGVPLRRLGTADEVASVCMFLLDEASAYVTGAVVPVDGGARVV